MLLMDLNAVSECAESFFQFIKQDPGIIADKKLLSAYCKDFFGAEKAKENAVILVRDCGITEAINNSDQLDDFFYVRFVKSVINDYGINDDLSSWVVCFWMILYGKCFKNKTILLSDKSRYTETPIGTNVNSHSIVDFSKRADAIQFNDDSVIKARLFMGNNGLYDVTIRESIAIIEEEAFKNCERLHIVSLNNCLRVIRKNAFRGCCNIQFVHSKSIASWLACVWENSYSNPLIYGAKLIINGEVLEDCVCPENCVEINSCAFVNYYFLKSIDLNKVEKIGSYSFYRCENISRLKIGLSTQVICKAAFRGCKRLKTIDFEGTLLQWQCIAIDRFAFDFDKNITVNCKDDSFILSI